MYHWSGIILMQIQKCSGCEWTEWSRNMGDVELAWYKGMIERERDRLLCYIGDSCYASTNSCVHREPLSLCLAEKSRLLSAGQERLPKLLSARFIISLRLPTVHLCTDAGRPATFKKTWTQCSLLTLFVCRAPPAFYSLPSFVYIFPPIYWEWWEWNHCKETTAAVTPSPFEFPASAVFTCPSYECERAKHFRWQSGFCKCIIFVLLQPNKTCANNNNVKIQRGCFLNDQVWLCLHFRVISLNKAL